jgi:signal transduction histidine kinase
VTKSRDTITRIRILLPILAAALPAFGLAIWLVVQGSAEQHGQVFERHELRARTTSIALSQVIRAQKAKAELLAASPLVTRPGTSEEVRDYLAEFFYVVDGWEVISVVDAAGRIIASTAAEAEAAQAYVGDRAYFQRVVATGEPVVSEPLVARTHQEPSIIVAVPVTFESGERGALTAALPLEFLQAAVAEHVPNSSRVQLLHEGGQAFIDTRWPRAPGELSRRHPGEAEVAYAALRGRAGAEIVSGPAGDLLLAYAPIAEYDWAVLVETPAPIAFRHADARLRTGLWLAALALGAIVALSWSFGGRLTAAMARVNKARGRAETARRRAVLAAEASKRLSATDSYESTIPAVAQLACAELGDEVTVELVDDEGLPLPTRALEEGKGLPPRVAESIRTHRPALQRGRAHAVAGEDVSALVAPIAANERLYGWMAFVTTGRHRVYAELGVTRAAGGADPSTSKEHFERIHRDAQRLARLVENMLELARTESGHVDWSMMGFDAGELIRDVVEGCKPQCATRGIDLLVDTHELSGQALGNPDRIAQVVSNLLSNAIKFTPDHSQIVVRAYRESVASEDPDSPPAPATELSAWAPLDPEGEGRRDVLRVDVQDAGPGLSEELRARLFEKFVQGRRRSGGIGLGLYISREIIERHGGSIWADSKPGEGATFSFRIPLRT